MWLRVLRRQELCLLFSLPSLAHTVFNKCWMTEKLLSSSVFQRVSWTLTVFKFPVSKTQSLKSIKIWRPELLSPAFWCPCGYPLRADWGFLGEPMFLVDCTRAGFTPARSHSSTLGSWFLFFCGWIWDQSSRGFGDQISNAYFSL